MAVAVATLAIARLYSTSSLYTLKPNQKSSIIQNETKQKTDEEKKTFYPLLDSEWMFVPRFPTAAPAAK